MDQGYRMFGFVVIVILYAVIGFMAAAGAIFIARKLLAPNGTQVADGFSNIGFVGAYEILDIYQESVGDLERAF